MEEAVEGFIGYDWDQADDMSRRKCRLSRLTLCRVPLGSENPTADYLKSLGSHCGSPSVRLLINQ